MGAINEEVSVLVLGISHLSLGVAQVNSREWLPSELRLV
jgi:hypothetical protein